MRQTRTVDRDVINNSPSISLDANLKARFNLAAKSSNRTAEDIILEFMRDYVDQQKQDESCNAYLGRKVAAARASIAAGRLISNEDVEKEFTKLRADP